MFAAVFAAIVTAFRDQRQHSYRYERNRRQLPVGGDLCSMLNTIEVSPTSGVGDMYTKQSIAYTPIAPIGSHSFTINAPNVSGHSAVFYIYAQYAWYSPTNGGRFQGRTPPARTEVLGGGR